MRQDGFCHGTGDYWCIRRADSGILRSQPDCGNLAVSHRACDTGLYGGANRALPDLLSAYTESVSSRTGSIFHYGHVVLLLCRNFSLFCGLFSSAPETLCVACWTREADFVVHCLRFGSTLSVLRFAEYQRRRESICVRFAEGSFFLRNERKVLFFFLLCVKMFLLRSHDSC